MIQGPRRADRPDARVAAPRPPAARVTEVTFEERKTEKRFERFQQQ